MPSPGGEHTPGPASRQRQLTLGASERRRSGEPEIGESAVGVVASRAQQQVGGLEVPVHHIDTMDVRLKWTHRENDTIKWTH